MRVVEITNEEEAETFFKTQTREVCCILASRAALRVAANLSRADGETFETLALTSFRAMLTSAGRGLGRPAEVEWLEATARSAALSTFSAISAARSAAFSARSAAFSALSAYAAAALSARSAAADAATAFSALSADAADAAYSALSADSADPGFSSPIWPAGLLPAAIESAHGAFLERLSAEDGPWLWWRDWYLGMWNGTPTDWDFALQVAKIDDVIWKQGARAVADEIERLQALYVPDTLPQVESVERDADGRYVLVNVEAKAPALLETALKQMAFMLEQCLGSNSSSLTSMCMAAKLLKYTRDECGDDPNAVEANFRMARSMILQNLDSGSYHREDAIETLVQVLEDGALQLRADHPDVATAVDRRTERKLKELDDAKRLELATHFHEMQEDTAGRLQSDYKMDGEIVAAEPGGEAQSEAIKRGANRASKIKILERAKDLESSGGMASTKIMLRVQSIIDIVLGIF
ncbi:MAG: hypothetical protein AAGH73_06615 [Pseudomonadota bacterium]